MLGLGTSLVKGGMAGRQYVKDGLKLYMPYRGADTTKGVDFVGTGSTSFDGSNDYISVASDSTLNINSNLTVSAWINPNDWDVNDASYSVVVDKDTDESGSSNFMFKSNSAGGSTGQLEFSVYELSTNTYVRSSGNISNGSWQHIVGTYDGSSLKVYINGILDGTATATGTPSTGNYLLYIGRRSNNASRIFDGSIKNVAIWNRALTATEIQNVMYKTYAEVSGRLSNGLVSWWALDVDYTDYHGDNDGTNSGSTLDTDLYGGDTPVKPRAIDNAPTVQADAIGSGSALFDGVDDYIDITSIASTINGIGDCTISCWVYIDPDCSANARIWSTEGDGSDDQNFLMVNNTSGQLRFETETSGGTSSLNGINGDGLWTHCACVYNDTTNLMYFYNNGVLQGSTSLGGTIEAKDFIIGARNDTPGNEFKGNVSQMGVWDAVLDQAQIQSIMEKTYEELTASEKTNLVSYWALDVDNSGLSNEMLTNGSFDSASNWTLGGNWAYDSANQKMAYDADGDTSLGQSSANMVSDIVPLASYTLTFTVSGGTARYWVLSSNGSQEYIGKTNYTAGTHTVTFTTPASSSGISFLAYDDNGGEAHSIDNVSLKETVQAYDSTDNNNHGSLI